MAAATLENAHYIPPVNTIGTPVVTNDAVQEKKKKKGKKDKKKKKQVNEEDKAIREVRERRIWLNSHSSWWS